MRLVDLKILKKGEGQVFEERDSPYAKWNLGRSK